MAVSSNDAFWRRTSGDLGELLLALTRRVRPERAADLTARVVFRVGSEAWTVRFDRGRMTVGYGWADRPDTIVGAGAETLIAINSGLVSGLDAFLEGRVTVRGNLGLALRLESLFEPLVRRPEGALEDVTVRAGRNDVSVMTGGSGNAVVLLHGLGATKASFLTTARALVPHYRVVAPDLLGHGDSAKPRAPYDAEFFARSIVELMDALGVERAHLVGNSLGGRISIETALRHPDRVASLTLLCPAMALIRGRQAAPIVRFLRPELAAFPLRIPHRAVVRGMRHIFARPDRLPRAWYEAGADEFLRIFRDIRARIALAAALRNIYLDQPRGLSGFWSRLRGLEAPALFVWGDRDPLVPVSFSHHVQRVLPDAAQVVLEDCGHVPQYELPDQTHGHVLDFLDRIA